MDVKQLPRSIAVLVAEIIKDFASVLQNFQHILLVSKWIAQWCEIKSDWLLIFQYSMLLSIKAALFAPVGRKTW